MVIRNWMYLFSRAWKIDRKYFFYVFMNLCCTGIYSYFIIRIPGIVLHAVQVKQIDVGILIFNFGMILLFGLGAVFAKYLFTPIGNRIRYILLHEIMAKNLLIPYEAYDDPKNLNSIWTINRAVSSIDGVQGFFLNFGLLCGNLSVVIISFGVLLQLSIWLALFIIIWLFLFALISIRTQNKQETFQRKSNPLYREYWYLGDIGTDFAFGKEIRVFKLQNWLTSKMKNVNKRLSETNSVIASMQFRLASFDYFYQFVRDGLIYGSLVYLYFNHRIDIGQFSSYSILILQLNSALKLTTDNLKGILSQHENYKAMIEFLAYSVQSNAGMPLSLDSEPWTITFEDVSFRYPETDQWIYEHLNFTLTQGEKIAVVGLNGAGKTTLLKLLMRLYKPTQGRICLNGVNIEDYRIEDYFSLFAPVFQDSAIFAFSVRDNLGFGHEIPDQAMVDSMARAGLDAQYLNKETLDREMTRYIHPDGLMFSGGQEQKFSVARAVCFNRPVYILDEPTSAMDAKAEHDFYTRMGTDFQDHTILFISHRLASTQFCDRIILIDEQGIKEAGTHHELMEKQGKYYHLFEVQSKYYKEGYSHEAL